MAGDTATLYTELSPISFTDIVPSRVTRISTNEYLQEHNLIFSSRFNPRPVSHNKRVALKGNYIRVDFSHVKPKSCLLEKRYREAGKACWSRAKEHLIDQRKSSSPIIHCESSVSTAGDMELAIDRPVSFAIAVDENPILFDDGRRGTTNFQTNQAEPPYAVRTAMEQSRRLRKIQSESTALHTVPPLPPKRISEESHFMLALSPTQDAMANTPSSSSSSVFPSLSPSPPPSWRVVTTNQSPVRVSKDQNFTSISGSYNSQSMDDLRYNTSPSHTKPTPPPRRRRNQSSPNIYSTLHTDNTGKGMSPFLTTDGGEEYGRFLVSYLGSKEVDMFTGAIDECAKLLMETKTLSRSTQVTAYVAAEKIRLAPPKGGPLFKSFAVRGVLGVGQCTMNRRIVGIIMWKPKTKPVCHLLRSTDQIISNTLLDALTQVIENLDSEELNKIERSMTPETIPDHRISCTSIDSELLCTSPTTDRDRVQTIAAVHIGSVNVDKISSIGDLIQKVLSENQPSQAKDISMWLTSTNIKLVDKSYQWEFIYAVHELNQIQTIGLSAIDQRFFGYIVKERHKPLTGHVLWCNSAATVASLLSFLKQACQASILETGQTCGKFESSESSATEARSIISRLRTLTSGSISGRMSPVQSSFQSYVGSPKSSAIIDLPCKRKNSIAVLSLPEEEYVRFSVNYVGSATLDPPFKPQGLIRAMQLFKQNGVAAGMAAVPKNVISMHVSALGINLTDKKHQMFITRNYPRKQIVGYCVHEMNSHYFGFATRRPGFDDLKVHVFMQLNEPVQQILDSVKFWLQMDPMSS